jgi:hypothetical protein
MERFTSVLGRYARTLLASARLVITVASVGLLVAGNALAVLNPVVTGPIAATAAPGDPSRNYPFLATILIPSGSGYVEEEFFMQGTAKRYTYNCTFICDMPSSFSTAQVVDSGHPYKVRMVVRRPTNPTKFNGKVIVEWQNVTNNWELDVQWYRASEYFIRQGYAWVGVGPQRAGIHSTPNGLRAWNPSRYGTLDVTQGGTFTDDSLQWDIFSQAAQAIINPVGVDPLGGLPLPRVPIATGDSQSSIHLAGYLNAIHPLDPIYPAFVLGGPVFTRIRADIEPKVFKIISEYDLLAAEANNRRPDTVRFVAWEVTGSSHSDYHNFVVNSPVRLRDVGVTGTLPGTANCIDPARSRVNLYLVYHAAYDWTVRWLSGEQPPAMPVPITVTNFTTNPVTVARDSFGIALGGIRLADVSVPIALNNGWNAGGKPPTSDSTCQQTGTYIPFDQATLNALYRNHGSYVSKVAHATNDNVRDGFLLEEGGETIKDEAAESSVGH